MLAIIQTDSFKSMRTGEKSANEPGPGALELPPWSSPYLLPPCSPPHSTTPTATLTLKVGKHRHVVPRKISCTSSMARNDTKETKIHPCYRCELIYVLHGTPRVWIACPPIRTLFISRAPDKDAQPASKRCVSTPWFPLPSCWT